MSRIRLSFPVKLLPAALAAALVMLGSTTVANAQSYDQSPSYDQSAPQDQNVQSDPSNRVARLAYLSGDVEFAPAGETDFGSADVNRPLVTGDRLITGNDGRAALELGDAALRINDDSAFNFLDLNDTTTQVELSQGALNLRVRQLNDGQTYEIDTPTVAFVAGEPGTYRVDVDPNGNGAMVTVFEGAGTVYGENGVSRPVQTGQSYRFQDSTLANVEVQGVPAPDDFDRFSEARDARYRNSISRRYVSADVVGYDDLDQYGDWQSTSDYGEVWYPNQVAAGWAPYRDGHWAWIDPWGWTWVDSEPWGYAPFHYGRWAYVRNRWGWIPGPREVEPVYAPALVAFVGGAGFSVSIGIGGGEPVGWFPLGPRDVYVPPYRASRNYFTNINVTNIRNVYVNKTVINNYYGSYAAGRPYAGAREYAYRNDARAFTAVPRNVFANARPVRAAVLHIQPGALAKATIAPIPHVAPTRASLAITPPKRPIAAPVAKAFDRTVIARHAPPPRPMPFAAREKVIAKQGGAPIPVAQLHQMRQQHAQEQAQPQHVHVIAATPKPGNALPPMKRVAGNPPATAHGPQPSTAPNPEHRPFNNTVRPIQAPLNPSNAQNPPQAAPMRPGELPSARFAHPQRGSNASAQEQRAAQMQQHAAQAQQNAQSHAAQAEQDRQNAGQARQRADQARQNEQAHAQQAQEAQQRAAQQDRQNEAQTRQHDQQMQAQQRAEQERQHADQVRAQQQAAQEHQHADQERAQQAQQQQQAAQERQRAQQDQQHAEQQRAQQEQQRAEQAHAQQQEQQQREEQMRAQQEQQRAEQAHAQQQEEQQREGQMRAQQEQQRAEQARMQQQEQQQREGQMRAQQQQRAQQPPRAQHAPPPQERKHHKQDQQDNGGH